VALGVALISRMPISLSGRNGESEELCLVLVQRFCEAHKALFMWESERPLPYSAQNHDLRKGGYFIWISALHEIGLMGLAMIAGV
jgi:hypothetical protein